jgi:hypothetical protein
MESGASAHETRDALGHSNLTMTNQYLSTSGIGLARASDRFERARQASDSDQSAGKSVNFSSSADAPEESKDGSIGRKSFVS